MENSSSTEDSHFSQADRKPVPVLVTDSKGII